MLNEKPKYLKSVIFVLITLIISDSIANISSAGYMFGSATYITALLGYLSLSIFIFIYFQRRSEIDVPNHLKYLYNFWIIVITFNLIRAFFLAETYWDWKALLLSYMFFSFIPLTFYLGEDIELAKTIFSIILKFVFPFGFLLIPIGLATNPELYSRIMIPVSLFILFIPFIRLKYKLLIIIVLAVSIMIVPGFRSNILKAAFSFTLIIVYYFRNIFKQNWLLFFQLLLFAIPFTFFTLAITLGFNIFMETEKNEGITVTDNNENGQNLTQDTRTFLYVEVFNSINGPSEWIAGKSVVGSYYSDFFYDEGGAMKGKRYECEVGILNILLKYGIIGVVAYFLLVFSVSWTAIKQSNNSLSKLIGLYIAFRWTYSFVEEYSQFDLNFFFFWLAIGLVSSTKFRNFSDYEIKTFLKI